jgi:hypothetical protein
MRMVLGDVGSVSTTRTRELIGPMFNPIVSVKHSCYCYLPDSLSHRQCFNELPDVSIVPASKLTFDNVGIPVTLMEEKL